MNKIIIRKFKIGRGYRHTMKCTNCSKLFEIGASKYNNGQGTYCSNRCRGEKQKTTLKGKNNPNWKGGLVTLECLYCKKSYNIKRKDAKRGSKYCSKDCMNKDLPRVIRERYKNQPELKNKTRHIGKKNGNYGKSAAHGKGAWYKGIWMRSTWEIKFAKWLDDKNLTWKYEPKRFELEDRTYAPDFYVGKWNSYIEIKGWFHERHKETVRQFKNNYPSIKLIVLQQKELNELGINV